MHITATPWLSSDRRPGIRACVGKVADASSGSMCSFTEFWKDCMLLRVGLSLDYAIRRVGSLEHKMSFQNAGYVWIAVIVAPVRAYVYLLQPGTNKSANWLCVCGCMQAYFNTLSSGQTVQSLKRDLEAHSRLCTTLIVSAVVRIFGAGNGGKQLRVWWGIRVRVRVSRA
jgi:hypothetical protein